MAKEKKTTGKAEQEGVEQALRDLNAQIQRIIAILERMEQRLSGGF